MVARLSGVHHPLGLVQVLPMAHDGCSWPEAGRRPLVVEVRRDPAFHLLPVAEVERGPVQEVVVAGGEAVDQVESEDPYEGDQGVLRHPPHLVGQEGGGEGAGDESGVVSADDGVEEDLLEPRVEVGLGDGHLHPYQLRRSWNAACCSQVGPERPCLVLVDLHPALASWGEVYERRGCCSEKYEVDRGRVDQVEDVHHAVRLHDKVCKVAQGDEDQADHAELGAVDKAAGGGDRQEVDDGGSHKMPQETSAEEDQREEDRKGIDQVEVHRLTCVRVGQPPDRPVQVEVLQAQGGCCVAEDDHLEGEGRVVGDVRDWDCLWVGERTGGVRLLSALRPEFTFKASPALTC